MKKVLLLTHEYFPFAGGVAMYCYNLFKNFPQERYLVASDCAALQPAKNIFRIKLSSAYLWPHWLNGLISVIKLVRREKIEIIFTPNVLPLGSIAYIINKLFGLPYVISLHGLDINLALKNKPTWAKKILKSAKHIVCNTRYTASQISNFIGQDKISIIYPLIDIEVDDSSSEEVELLKNKYKLGQAKIILTVGRLVERKGHALVIEALKELKDINCKYLIVGDGPHRASLERQIKENNLQDRVMLLGKAGVKDLPYFYKLAHVFAMPNQIKGSDVEGFGMVFLEAAAFSLPIIAGSSGGVKEIFTGQDDVCYADKSPAIVTALRSFLIDEAKAKSYGLKANLVYKRFKDQERESIKLMEKILS